MWRRQHVCLSDYLSEPCPLRFEVLPYMRREAVPDLCVAEVAVHLAELTNGYYHRGR